MTIATWLQSTLLPDQQARQAAEEALKQAEAQPGCAVLLFRLAVDQSLTQVEPALRQAAAIHMKNLIVRRWERREPNKFMNNRFASNEPPAEPLADADKAVVRSNLMEAIIVSPSVVRSQLGLCLRTIVQADYPAAWPELLPSICNGMTSPEPAREPRPPAKARALPRLTRARRLNRISAPLSPSPGVRTPRPRAHPRAQLARAAPPSPLSLLQTSVPYPPPSRLACDHSHSLLPPLPSRERRPARCPLRAACARQSVRIPTRAVRTAPPSLRCLTAPPSLRCLPHAAHALALRHAPF